MCAWDAMGGAGLTYQHDLCGEVGKDLDSGQMLSFASAFWALACPAGLYGKDCQHSCLCRNGGSCDPVSGQCTCPEGWTGLACEKGELAGLGSRHVLRPKRTPF